MFAASRSPSTSATSARVARSSRCAVRNSAATCSGSTLTAPRTGRSRGAWIEADGARAPIDSRAASIKPIPRLSATASIARRRAPSSVSASAPAHHVEMAESRPVRPARVKRSATARRARPPPPRIAVSPDGIEVLTRPMPATVPSSASMTPSGASRTVGASSGTSSSTRLRRSPVR